MIHHILRKAVLSLFLFLTAGAASLHALNFKPIQLAAFEVKSFSGFSNSLSYFLSQVKPEAAGQVVFFAAALAMNPQTAAIDLNKPLRMVLLTGAGQNVMNANGEYRPDMFFCISATLRKGAALEDTLPTFAGTIKVHHLSENRVLLYLPQPLFDKHLTEIARKFFSAPPSPSELEMNLDLNAISRIPGVTTGFKNTLMTSQNWNPAYDNAVSDFIDDALSQIHLLSMKVNFLKTSTINLTGNLIAVQKSTLAKYTALKNDTVFNAPSTFKTAKLFTLISISPTQQLKKYILNRFASVGIPAYAQECIMRSNGKIVLSQNLQMGLTKLSVELENGAMQPVLTAMKNDKTIRQLTSGLWILDYQEDRKSTYAELKDNKLITISGTLSERMAKRLLDDPTPLPEQVELGNSAIANFIKLENEIFVRKSDIRYTPGRINFSFRISVSDFPKKQHPQDAAAK